MHKIEFSMDSKEADSTKFHDNLAYERTNSDIKFVNFKNSRKMLDSNIIKSLLSSYKMIKKAKLEDEALSKANILPKSVVLSWDYVTVRTEENSIKEKLLYATSFGKRGKKFKTILDDIRGIVEPGELLGLIGPRLVVNVKCG